jgi:hypothetical protein
MSLGCACLRIVVLTQRLPVGNLYDGNRGNDWLGFTSYTSGTIDIGAFGGGIRVGKSPAR